MNEQQIKNTLTFLQRVELKGSEAMAMAEIQSVLSKELQNHSEPASLKLPMKTTEDKNDTPSN